MDDSTDRQPYMLLDSKSTGKEQIQPYINAFFKKYHNYCTEALICSCRTMINALKVVNHYFKTLFLLLHYSRLAKGYVPAIECV
uniref:Uncharacterized protein n=1 Tax=Anguilla anguilla TaxID=7936 RepID=A0A0E9WNV2_ANGAN